jgi:aryl-alcohol dehydrogenase-like predicted oxidoreductase
MRAIPEATRDYHRLHPGIHTSILGRTGLVVSGAGYGGYRVSKGVEAHHQSLRAALGSGINLIDTSANYADGASEELIGETIGELIRDGSIARNQIVVVSKGGYIQGSNYRMAQERIESGSGFPDVVEYGPGLWHCIAPEFLYDQITRSLNRLQLRAIDVYLLHNPEYYLSWAAKQGVPLDEARQEYYRRIRMAFQHLEREVEEGRIGCYGISSNSFPHPSKAADFTSLEEVVKIAEKIALTHHFSVIQFPANLGETGFVTEHNQSENRTVMDLAREKNLGVLINRPLNVIHNDRLIRMADFPTAETCVDDETIARQAAKLVRAEEEFLSARLEDFADDPEGSHAMKEFISVGKIIERHWKSFGSIEQFNDMMSQHFAPRLSYVGQYLRQRADESNIGWFDGYVNEARALIHAVACYYSLDAQQRTQRVKESIAATLGAPVEGTLSSISIRMLLGVEGVDCVLVGMRRGEYTEDVLNALRAGPLGTEEIWDRLDLEEALNEPHGSGEG